MSAKFTVVAAMRMRTCPGPGSGSGTSCSLSTSGAPHSVTTTAFMMLLLYLLQRFHAPPDAVESTDAKEDLLAARFGLVDGGSDAGEAGLVGRVGEQQQLGAGAFLE